jgi:hypothetical protein
MKKHSAVAATDELHWFKSSYSAGNGGDCVEVADADVAILVRDSKRPHDAHLGVAPAQWETFVRMLKNR